MKKGRTVLIVDDEIDYCMLLRRVLRKRFAHVACAYSLLEGVTTAAFLQPDVILLDNNLSDGYGIEYISKFKKAAKKGWIVMISAMDIREEALGAGADDFSGKPANLEALKAIR